MIGEGAERTNSKSGLSSHINGQSTQTSADDESLYTAEDSCDTNLNARPPPINPANNLLDTGYNSINNNNRKDAADIAMKRRSGTPPPHPRGRKLHDIDKQPSYNLEVIEPYNDSGSQRSGSRHSGSQRGRQGSSPLSNSSKSDSYGDDEEICPMETDNDEDDFVHVEGTDTFILPGDIHPNMENREDEISQLRLLAGKLSADWRGSDFMAPALARRIRDFQFAQEKRRKKYGDERPWGILGLYDFLSAIRTDVEWAEDAAWRRANNESYQSWADFEEQRKKGYNRPFFTYTLLFVCSVIMIASIVLNDWQVEPLDVNPMIGPSAETLIEMGAKDTTKIVEENEGWRLISSTVLHAGLVHYLVNMLALWFVGAAIETSHGWLSAAVIFCISAVGGTILSGIFLPEYITVGASGGIFGFIGACIADIIMNWNLLFCDFVTENGKKHRHILVVVFLFMDIALNSIIGLTPFVDNFTHLGGMAYGFLCGLSTMQRLSMGFFGMEDTVLTQAKQFFFRFFGIIASLLCLVVTLLVLLNMDSNSTPCPGCTWLSCVPFPPWEDETNKWWYCDDCNTVTASIVDQPYASLEVNCPGGDLAFVNITDTQDRDDLQKNLPSYCREYCPETRA